MKLQWTGLGCALLAGAVLLSSAAVCAQTQTKPPQKHKTLSFTCRVVYEPSRALWVRELEVDYDKNAFIALRIDGVSVHGFSAQGAQISTHLDNERIHLDLSAPRWRSEFREAAQGEGVCVKAKG
jgi:hypothetical protein